MSAPLTDDEIKAKAADLVAIIKAEMNPEARLNRFEITVTKNGVSVGIFRDKLPKKEEPPKE